MRPDFVDKLKADIARFEQAIVDRNSGRDSDVTATASADVAMQRALDAIRRLDAIVPNRLQDDAVMLGSWKEARRVRYPPKKTETAAQHVSPAAATAAAAV